MATANVSLLTQANVKYILSTGGAAGSFTCASDAGMAAFIDRWASPNLIGVDFDIEAGQSQQVIGDLVARIKAAHTAYPNLRFSLTLATLANNDGGATAQSLGAGAPDSFNVYGDKTMAAVKSTLGFDGTPATWPVVRDGRPHDDGLRLAVDGRVRGRQRRLPDGPVGAAGRVQPARPVGRAVGQHRADADDRRQRRRRRAVHARRRGHRRRRSPSRRSSPACTTGRTTATSTARRARPRRRATRSATPARAGSSRASSAAGCCTTGYGLSRRIVHGAAGDARRYSSRSCRRSSRFFHSSISRRRHAIAGPVRRARHRLAGEARRQLRPGAPRARRATPSVSDCSEAQAPSCDPRARVAK